MRFNAQEITGLMIPVRIASSLFLADTSSGATRFEDQQEELEEIRFERWVTRLGSQSGMFSISLMEANATYGY